MSNRTLCDSCAETVSIDYGALVLSISYAFRQCKESVNRAMAEIDSFDATPHHRAFYAGIAADRANELAIVGELYSTIINGQTREIKKLVNVPEIPEPKQD